MKLNNVPKSALVLLITGLLMVTLPPIINRYFPLPDFLKGFLNGLGLTLEVISIIKTDRNKKKSKCTISNA
jgi:hypothetical protein